MGCQDYVTPEDSFPQNFPRLFCNSELPYFTKMAVNKMLCFKLLICPVLLSKCPRDFGHVLSLFKIPWNHLPWQLIIEALVIEMSR
jgi:hypothetical protein